MGSNGLTSARHDVFHKYLKEKYPESYDPAVPSDLVYAGPSQNNYFAEMCSGSEAGSYLRLIDF